MTTNPTIFVDPTIPLLQWTTSTFRFSMTWVGTPTLERWSKSSWNFLKKSHVTKFKMEYRNKKHVLFQVRFGKN